MSNAGGMATVTRYTDMLAGNTTWNPWSPDGAYDALATVTVPSGGLSSITFAGIPSTYKHLQVRGIVRPTTNNAEIRLTLNSDSSAIYARHRLIGNGSSIDATGTASQTSIGIFDANGLQTGTASVFGALIIDLLDYASTSKYKTIRVLSGNDNNGSGQVGLSSGLWQNTNAVTNLSMVMNTGNVAEFSQFSLYGVR